MLISKSLRHYGCVYEVPYSQVAMEAPLLLRREILDRHLDYKKKCRAARLAYQDLYGWEQGVEAMRNAFRSV